MAGIIIPPGLPEMVGMGRVTECASPFLCLYIWPCVKDVGSAHVSPFPSHNKYILHSIVPSVCGRDARGGIFTKERLTSRRRKDIVIPLPHGGDIFALATAAESWRWQPAKRHSMCPYLLRQKQRDACLWTSFSRVLEPPSLRAPRPRLASLSGRHGPAQRARVESARCCRSAVWVRSSAGRMGAGV